MGMSGAGSNEGFTKTIFLPIISKVLKKVLSDE